MHRSEKKAQHRPLSLLLLVPLQEQPVSGSTTEVSLDYQVYQSAMLGMCEHEQGPHKAQEPQVTSLYRSAATTTRQLLCHDALWY